MPKQNLKPELNKLLEQMTLKGDSQAVDEDLLNAGSRIIWSECPFAHIANFSSALKALEKHWAWISYGGSRTGSTFVTMVLKILLDSMVESFLIGWEGDFKEPAKFFELAKSTPRVEACILKIHRSEKFCNKLLRDDKAKAVVSTRDYPSVAASYARMKDNPCSPFYSAQKITDEQLLGFIANQISTHKKKLDLPNTLFIKESDVREMPYAVVLNIAEYMGLCLTTASAHIIGEELNIESQRERQKNLITNSTGHSGDNFLHCDHVNPVDQVCDKYIYDLVFDRFGDQLDDEGYLLQG